MRAFKGKVFSRWVKKENIDDKALCLAARESFAGKVDGDLGSHLFKKRVARKGEGKSGGYRTILGSERRVPIGSFSSMDSLECQVQYQFEGTQGLGNSGRKFD